jgi:hypothetical protein
LGGEEQLEDPDMTDSFQVVKTVGVDSDIVESNAANPDRRQLRDHDLPATSQLAESRSVIHLLPDVVVGV